MRGGLAATLVVAALMLTPAVASAVPILEEADAADLAATLADAEAAQGVCYGWRIEVDDETGEFTGVDEGSSGGGPGTSAGVTDCPRHALLVGRVVFTSDASEAEDGAGVDVVTSLDPPVTADALQGIGLGAEGLLGDTDDLTLIGMVEALPLLAGEVGAAPFVPFAPNTAPLAADEMPTDRPGSDWWRIYWPLVVILSIVGLIALVVAGVGLAALRARMRGPRPPADPPARPHPPEEAA